MDKVKYDKAMAAATNKNPTASALEQAIKAADELELQVQIDAALVVGLRLALKDKQATTAIPREIRDLIETAAKAGIQLNAADLMTSMTPRTAPTTPTAPQGADPATQPAASAKGKGKKKDDESDDKDESDGSEPDDESDDKDESDGSEPDDESKKDTKPAAPAKGKGKKNIAGKVGGGLGRLAAGYRDATARRPKDDEE